MEEEEEEQAYGFLPQQVVEGLAKVGNWEARADAIDLLSQTVDDLQEGDVGAIHLGEFLAFLLHLIPDANFKIAMNALEILAVFIGKIGKRVRTFAGTIVNGMLDRLGDSKQVIRQSALLVISALIKQSHVKEILPQLTSPGLCHTNWRIRQEIVSSLAMVVLLKKLNRSQQQQMGLALVRCLSDRQEQVATTALEVIALLSSNIQPSQERDQLIEQWCQEGSAPQGTIPLICMRILSGDLPHLNSKGLVVYKMSSASSPTSSPTSRKPSYQQERPNQQLQQQQTSQPSTYHQIYIKRKSTEHPPVFEKEQLSKNLYIQQPSPKNQNQLLASNLQVFNYLNENETPHSIIESGETSPDRMSIGSPSRGARLAALKQRQLAARRAHSANAIIQSTGLEDQGGLEGGQNQGQGQDQGQIQGQAQGQPVSQNNLATLRSKFNTSPEKGSFCRAATASLTDSRDLVSMRSSGSAIRGRKLVLDKTQCSDVIPYTQLDPCQDADGALQSMLRALGSANSASRTELDWQAQFDALNLARRLVKHHSSVVRQRLGQFVGAVLPGVEQLQSLTSKASIILVQELFSKMGPALDKNVEEIVPVLMKRSSDISTAGREHFLAGEADKALQMASTYASPVKTLSAFLTLASHKSCHIVGKSAYHLDYLLSNTRARNWVSNNSSMLQKLFQTALLLLEQGSLETRNHGKRILCHLSSILSPNEDVLERLIDGIKDTKQKKRVNDILVQGMPSERPNGIVTRGSSASSSNFGGWGSSTATTPESPIRSFRVDAAKRSRTRVDEIGGEGDTLVEGLLSHIGSNNWRVRLDSLKNLENSAPCLRDMEGVQLGKVVDQLVARMNDSNPKVNIQALKTFGAICRDVGDRICVGMNHLIPVLTSNLGATNERIRQAANEAMDALVDNVEPAMLVQNFSHCINHGSTRGKAVMIEKLAEISQAVYRQKPSLVHKHVAPIGLSLLNDQKSDVRGASNRLVQVLIDLIGDQLLLHMDNLSPQAKIRFEQILQERQGAIQHILFT